MNTLKLNVIQWMNDVGGVNIDDITRCVMEKFDGDEITNIKMYNSNGMKKKIVEATKEDIEWESVDINKVFLKMKKDMKMYSVFVFRTGNELMEVKTLIY